MSTRPDVYAAIDRERDYQTTKWGNPSHSNVEFLVYMRDYIDEALHLASRNSDEAIADAVRHNIRKVTALGVAALEQNGVLPR